VSLVAIDTDVLAIHHIFTWDKRYSVNKEFLKRVSKPATTIHNLLELVSIAFRALRGDKGLEIYRTYMLSGKWSILFPDMPSDWSEYCEKVFSYLRKGMSYGDAVIAWTIDEHSDLLDSFVTWNKKDFVDKLEVDVYTPEEWLKNKGYL